MRDVKKTIRIRRDDGVLPSREQMEELLGSVCLAKSSKYSISCQKKNQKTTNTHTHQSTKYPIIPVVSKKYTLLYYTHIHVHSLDRALTLTHAHTIPQRKYILLINLL